MRRGAPHRAAGGPSSARAGLHRRHPRPRWRRTGFADRCRGDGVVPVLRWGLDRAGPAEGGAGTPRAWREGRRARRGGPGHGGEAPGAAVKPAARPVVRAAPVRATPGEPSARTASFAVPAPPRSPEPRRQGRPGHRAAPTRPVGQWRPVAAPPGRRERPGRGVVAGEPYAPGGHASPVCAPRRPPRFRAGAAPAPAPAGAAPGVTAAQLTRPYHTAFVQIFWSFTTSPVFGACQIFP